MRVVLATRNRHKVSELERLLASPRVRFEDLDTHPEVPEIVEDGATFEENAAKKARITASAAGVVALADDSGLEVDALGGAPGVRSARYAGEDADDAANRAKLLRTLAGVPDDARGARFRCVIAIATPEGKVRAVDGVCEGTILAGERGTGGFGYDRLFVPKGKTLTFAELPDDEKDSISHRADAARRAVRVLEDVAGQPA